MTRTFHSPKVIAQSCGFVTLGVVVILLPPSDSLRLPDNFLLILGILNLLCALYSVGRLRHTRVVLSKAGVETATSPSKRRFFAWSEINDLREKKTFVNRADWDSNPVAYFPNDLFWFSLFGKAILEFAPHGHCLREYVLSRKKSNRA